MRNIIVIISFLYFIFISIPSYAIKPGWDKTNYVIFEVTCMSVLGHAYGLNDYDSQKAACSCFTKRMSEKFSYREAIALTQNEPLKSHKIFKRCISK
jgi:hypothetical protein